MTATRLWTNSKPGSNFDGSGNKGTPGWSANIPISNMDNYEVLAIACKLYTSSGNGNPFINYINVKAQRKHASGGGIFLLCGGTPGSPYDYRYARLVFNGISVSWSAAMDGEHTHNDGTIPLYVNGLR